MDEFAPVTCSRIGDVLWIRVDGKGSFKNSGGLQEYLEHLIRAGDPTPFIIDLDNCPVMDSTFMGTLSGLAKEIRESGTGGHVEIINASDRNRQLMRNLGLDYVLKINEDPESRAEERKLAAAGVATEQISRVMSKEEQARHILEAHQNLGDVDPKNIPKFKDVVKFFKEELDKLKGKENVDNSGADE